MKKNFIFLILLFILFAYITYVNFVFSQATQTPQISTGKITLEMFYSILRPAADVGCLSGSDVFQKITNCVTTIAKALQYLAVILFVIGLTYVAGLMIIVPFKTDSINQAKTILIWIIIGFIILFIIEKIMQLIKQLAG